MLVLVRREACGAVASRPDFFSRARAFCVRGGAPRLLWSQSGVRAPRGEKLLLAGDTQNVFHTRPHARRSLACVLEMTGGPETVLPSPICLRVGLYFETVISSPAWPKLCGKKQGGKTQGSRDAWQLSIAPVHSARAVAPILS